jgi:1-acyl-sn-glycerol-3-phosphate acyltransferase
MLVDRSRPDRSGIFGWANSLTSKGLSLIVFPEGTRSADGRVGVFKGGSFYLAIQAGLPIAPLSIVGSRHVMRKGRLTTRPGRVTLIVHEPIETRPDPDPPTTEVRELARRVREIVRPAPDAEAQADASRLVSDRTTS